MRNQEGVWHVPEANRAYVPDIYGTPTLHQAWSPASYLAGFTQQEAVGVEVTSRFVGGCGDGGRRLREIANGHEAVRWWNWDLNLGHRFWDPGCPHYAALQQA